MLGAHWIDGKHLRCENPSPMWKGATLEYCCTSALVHDASQKKIQTFNKKSLNKRIFRRCDWSIQPNS